MMLGEVGAGGSAGEGALSGGGAAAMEASFLLPFLSLYSLSYIYFRFIGADNSILLAHSGFGSSVKI
jgi:hypothetical protein